MIENAKAQANIQPKVVESERGVEISKNLANGEIEKAVGDSRAIEVRALLQYLTGRQLLQVGKIGE